MTFPDTVEYLYSIGNEVKTVKLGLERMRVLLEALGDPHRKVPYIHVAGTNGKGSTSAMIESALRLYGQPVGLYTSPHLVSPVERIQVNGQPIDEAGFLSAFTEVHKAAERLLDSGRIDLHPTYFETVTAMAFVWFWRQRVRMAVLEVGLGGRLDATNVVLPSMSVITPVDFDHEAWLGSGILDIAGEKAGIIKHGVPVTIAPQRYPEAENLLLDRAHQLAAPAVSLVREARGDVTDLTAHGSKVTVTAFGHTLVLDVPFAGEHQADNAATAAVALLGLGQPPETIRQGIKTAKWPGRLERVAENPDIILDGAHNPAGVRALAAYIKRFFADRKVWLIYGTMRDKSVDEIGDTLLPEATEVILTQPGSERALRPEAMLELFSHPRMRTAPRLADALAIVNAEAKPEDAVFITGSLYLVGEARPLFVK